MKKFEAIIATGLTADIFRTVCDKIGKNPDAEYFYGIDVNDIKDYAIQNGLLTFRNNNLQDGYSVAEAAALLKITKQSFSVTYSSKVSRIRRGVYSKEEIDKLVNAKFKNSSNADIAPVNIPVINTDDEVINKQKRIQRISVNTSNDGVSVTLHLENYTDGEILNRLIKLFK